jgi:hypothetical protein
VGWLEVAAGIDNGKAQLVIVPAPAPDEATHSSANSVGDNGGKTAIDELNEELFG